MVYLGKYSNNSCNNFQIMIRQANALIAKDTRQHYLYVKRE